MQPATYTANGKLSQTVNNITYIGNGAKVAINGSICLDPSNGSGISYANGKLRLNLLDVNNKAFQLEWNVGRREEAVALQEIVQQKMQRNNLYGKEFAELIQTMQEKAGSAVTHEKEDDIHLKKEDNFKTMSCSKLRLSVQSLVQNLYKAHANKGLHKGWQPNFDLKA